MTTLDLMANAHDIMIEIHLKETERNNRIAEYVDRGELDMARGYEQAHPSPLADITDVLAKYDINPRRTD